MLEVSEEKWGRGPGKGVGGGSEALGGEGGRLWQLWDCWVV